MATRKQEEKADNVSIIIAKKLANFYHPTPECCIFRMYDHLAKENKKAYEPSIVAIGPYHRGKADLQQMEKHKLWCLIQFLNREEEKSADKYIVAIRALEGRARNCYAESISLESDEFVEMLLIDGLFIIELFCKIMDRKFKHMDDHIFQSEMDRKVKHMNDHIFQSEHICHALRRDLVLLENQVPFFILDHLFRMTNRDSNLGIIGVALNFFVFDSPEGKFEAPSEIQIDNIKHLLHLVYDCFCFEFAETPRNVSEQKWEFINSAIELQEAGIRFKRVKRYSNIFDIKFINGVLEIPLVPIMDTTESFFTNLVAFELLRLNKDLKMYVCDYIVFMNCLINSSKDVHLLRRIGIIDSRIGDDEAVYTMWHNLFKISVTYNWTFGYSEVFNGVNNHCRRHRNVWMANLRRNYANLMQNYFNSPWTLISLLAAVIMLLLTVAQTICSILSFGRGGI